MSSASFPSQMLGGVLVVTAPAEIDITAAGPLRVIPFDWCAWGHTTVVVDMTGTQSCDPAGIRAGAGARAGTGQRRRVAARYPRC
jgi:anti-anti-sigma regulatory factor